MAIAGSKIKILFVITKSNLGGAQKYVFDLATRLPKEQFEVSVVLGGDGLLADKLRGSNIRIITISSLLRDVNIFKDAVTFFTLWKLFRAERPDVVHLNSAKVSGLGALAARLARVPKIIFTAHGWAFNEERVLPSRIIIKFLSWMTILLSHKTIAVSKSVQTDTDRWPFVNNKIITIRNGVKESEFYPRDEARTKLFARISGEPTPNIYIVGTIAELHKNKGLEYAIEAFAKIIPNNPNLYYFILGGGEEKDRLSALVEHHGLQERVLLLGYVEDAARFLKAFDVFILPSIKEGLPFVVLEAGLARVPVIATKVGGIPEVIENEKSGLLVASRDGDAIAKAIQKLREGPELVKHLEEALRDKVANEFSLERTFKETSTVYKSL